MTQESTTWGFQAEDSQQRLDEAEDRRTLNRIGLVMVGVTLLTMGLVSIALGLG